MEKIQNHHVHKSVRDGHMYNVYWGSTNGYYYIRVYRKDGPIHEDPMQFSLESSFLMDYITDVMIAWGITEEQINNLKQ